MRFSIGLTEAAGEPGVAGGEAMGWAKWRTSLKGRGAGVLLSGSSEDRA